MSTGNGKLAEKTVDTYYKMKGMKIQIRIQPKKQFYKSN